jgi:hypothetical protein
MNIKKMLWISFLAAAILFSSTGADPGTQKYLVTVTSTEKSICVGQSTTVTVGYRLQLDQTEDNKPIIKVHGNNGTIDPKVKAGAYSTDSLPFVFTATEPGLAYIFADINVKDGGSMVVIRVLKECKYAYKLIVTMPATSTSGDLKFKWKDVITSEGTIIATESTSTTNTAGAEDLASLAPLVPLKDLKQEMRILELMWPSNKVCIVADALWTPKGGTGTVSVEGTIDKYTNSGITITLDNPKNNYSLYFRVPCKDGPPASGNASLDISGTSSPWIKETFSPEGGTKLIKIDLFEKAMDNLNNKSGGTTTATYTAELSLKRVK